MARHSLGKGEFHRAYSRSAATKEPFVYSVVTNKKKEPENRLRKKQENENLFVKIAVASFTDVAALTQASRALGDAEEIILRQFRLFVRNPITLLHFNSLHKFY